MDACCIISWFCAIYAFAEYTKIVDRLNYDVFSFIIEDNPKHRINSTFFNANYYAMMIEFIVLICIYKMMQVKTKRRIIFYISTILVNLFILYLTGCRTAWIPFVVSIPFLFLMNKRFLYFSMTMSAYGGAGGILLLKPGIFQRTTLFTDFGKRFKIWNCAIKGIKAHPWFGEGPLTYYHIYKQYQGHPTQHAHSVYLDPILSYGIVGVILLGCYFVSNVKEIWILLKRRLDLRLCSLILACILTVLIHGILDYTIYWNQTALLFLMIMGSSSIYFHKD
jgi:O-antigen ligase